MKFALSALGLAALATACSKDHPAQTNAPDIARIAFTDVTTDSGLDCVQTAGRTPATQLPEVKGTGLALIDYDNDGDLDVFVPNGAYLDAPDKGPGCRMFENLGSLKFRDVTAALGLNYRGWGMGAAVGDVDGDGFDDIYIAAFGADVLLRNDAGKRFVDATTVAGLGNEHWGMAAAFGDIDGDGDLDLYVVNYIRFDAARPYPPERFHGVPVFAGPVGKPCDADVLYTNDGHGRFTDISVASGITAPKPSTGLGVAIFDVDGDGRQDIFVGNDSMPNFLFMNRGENKFEELATASGIALNGDGAAQATMGIAIADVNDDGKPDVFTTNFANDTNTLHVSAKNGLFFSDRTSQYGLGQISRPYLCWATAFHDFDLDGDEDLVVFDGHVYPNATRETMDSTWAQVPLLFERKSERFERVEASARNEWLGQEHADRSAVFGDLDGDGDVDIIVGGVNQKLRVLANEARGNWVAVELLDERPAIGNRHGLGARVVLTQAQARQSRWIVSGAGYQSASTTLVHFGLQDDSTCALEVTWPDGHAQKVGEIKPGQRFVVRRR
ncbi:MAG: CRTAC1 family protein [Planctomycetes bacterium]|nr:CRTAC1 family protein [Planctomycetota bacterium]